MRVRVRVRDDKKHYAILTSGMHKIPKKRGVPLYPPVSSSSCERASNASFDAISFARQQAPSFAHFHFIPSDKSSISALLALHLAMYGEVRRGDQAILSE